jgi:hypothetical protein
MRAMTALNNCEAASGIYGNLKLTFPLLLMLAIKGGSYRRQNLAISRSAATSMAAISAPL